MTREFHCEDCGYEGHCYGIPSSEGVSAPHCYMCGRNGRLVLLDEWRNRMKQWTKNWNEVGLGFIAVATIIVIIVGLVYVAAGIWVYNEAFPEAPQHQGPYPEQNDDSYSEPNWDRVRYPEQSEDRIPGDTRFMGMPPPPDCGHLYNHPGKHREWSECMGVGYSSSKADALLWDDRDGLAPDCATVPFGRAFRKWMAHCAASGRD